MLSGERWPKLVFDFAHIETWPGKEVQSCPQMIITKCQLYLANYKAPRLLFKIHLQRPMYSPKGHGILCWFSKVKK